MGHSENSGCSVSAFKGGDYKLIGDKKEVYFGDYCPKCIYKDKVEDKEPCCDCLDSPSNVDSHKPLYFKEASENEKSNCN